MVRDHTAIHAAPERAEYNVRIYARRAIARAPTTVSTAEVEEWAVEKRVAIDIDVGHGMVRMLHRLRADGTG